MGFETPEEGYLAKVLIPAGTKGVPVGKLLCIIVGDKADVAAFKDFKEDDCKCDEDVYCDVMQFVLVPLLTFIKVSYTESFRILILSD